MQSKSVLIVCVALTLFFVNMKEGSDKTVPGQINYTLEIDTTTYDRARVQIALAGKTKRGLTFQMPKWSPGAYRMRHYPNNVHGFSAYTRDGQLLPFERTMSNGWLIDGEADGLWVEYTVEFPFQSWSGAGFDSTYALVEGSNVFMYVDERRYLPTEVQYLVPSKWKIASPLQQASIPGRYFAANYDALVDAPAQLGFFEEHSFQIEDAEIELIFHGDATFSPDSFTTMVKKICTYQTGFFGEIPFDKYIFFYKILPGYRGGGGLEHRNSATIGLSGGRLNQTVLSAAEVTAHEFFHLWNVKRIFPSDFEQPDYQSEVRTNTLWFLEGVTSYYEPLTLLRSGLWSQYEFIAEIESQVAYLQETEERTTTSVEEASWRAWERAYLHPGVSFYNKGEVLGLLLDLKVRALTQNQASLDDLMKEMNNRFGRAGVSFATADIRQILFEITGHDFSEFFELYISGTDELPYAEILRDAGMAIDIKRQVFSSIGDVIFVGPQHRVVALGNNSTAAAGGLRRGDLVQKLDGKKVDSLQKLHRRILYKQVGSTVNLTVLRGERQLALNIEVGRGETVDCRISPASDPAPGALAVRSGWLGGWTGRSPSPVPGTKKERLK